MESKIISQRAFAFACRIVKLCERLWVQGPAARKIADQLFDCGTSIGANSAESQGGQTKPDFIAKLAISRKESWETIFWLRLAIATSVVTKQKSRGNWTKRNSYARRSRRQSKQVRARAHEATSNHPQRSAISHDCRSSEP